MQDILEYGKRAPSSHNAQMWKVTYKENIIIIKIDSTKLLSCVDPLNRETWISLGAFTENSILRAYELGYYTNLMIEEDLLKLEFSKSSQDATNKYSELIFKRRTNRRKYKKDKLKEEDICFLENFVADSIYYYPLNSDAGEIISKSIYKANYSQLNDSLKLSELSDWTITSKKEETERMDGLTPTALGMNDFTKFFFRLLFNKKSLQSKRFVKLALADVKKQIENCSGFIVITSLDDSNKSLIEIGRKLEKLWLELTQRNVSVHPMSQPIEENDIYENLTKELGFQDKHIQMILRIGYDTKKDLLQSKRRNV